MYSHSPDSTCLCKPQFGYCSAAYYSTGIRSVPETCTTCGNPTDVDCLRRWSNCVKRRDKAAHGCVSYNCLYVVTSNPINNQGFMALVYISKDYMLKTPGV